VMLARFPRAVAFAPRFGRLGMSDAFDGRSAVAVCRGLIEGRIDAACAGVEVVGTVPFGSVLRRDFAAESGAVFFVRGRAGFLVLVGPYYANLVRWVRVLDCWGSPLKRARLVLP